MEISHSSTIEYLLFGVKESSCFQSREVFFKILNSLHFDEETASLPNKQNRFETSVFFEAAQLHDSYKS